MSIINIDNLIVYKISITKYKKEKFIMTFIDISDEIKNQNILSKIANIQYELINSIYPKHVIDSLHENENMNMIARKHNKVSIMFADIVGFTEMSNFVEPEVIMEFLNNLFEVFDNLNKKYNIFKLETVGDCYVAVSGLFSEDTNNNMVCENIETNNADNLFNFARECIETAYTDFKMPHNNKHVILRIGIHSGPVTSGIIGNKMPKYCLFGETMNIASRMESLSIPNYIQISEITYQDLGDLNKKALSKRKPFHVKGKGIMVTYLYKNSTRTSSNKLIKFFDTIKLLNNNTSFPRTH